MSAFESSPQLLAFGTPLIANLPDGVSPLVFPIIVQGKKRDQLRRELISLKVFCTVHWPLPKDIDDKAYPQAHRTSEGILGLPVDQRYALEDMESLINRLQDAWAVAS